MRPDPCFVEHWDPCWLKFIHMPPLQRQHEARELSEMLCQILRRCYKSCRPWRALSLALPLLPHLHSLLLPLGVAALLQEHPVHWWQVSGISVVQLTPAHDTHSKSIESREEGNGRAGAERESASSVAWKSATATAAAAALTLSATVNSLLTCAKPFVYFCLAADTKKITKRAAKIKGRAQKCCKSKIR